MSLAEGVGWNEERIILLERAKAWDEWYRNRPKVQRAHESHGRMWMNQFRRRVGSHMQVAGYPAKSTDGGSSLDKYEGIATLFGECTCIFCPVLAHRCVIGFGISCFVLMEERFGGHHKLQSIARTVVQYSTTNG